MSFYSNGIYFDEEKNRYRAEVRDDERYIRIRKRFKTKALAKRWIRFKLGRVPNGGRVNWRYDFAMPVY